MIYSNNRLEVPIGAGVQSRAPMIIYTKTVATCLGLGFYQPATKEGSLYHIAGAEDSSVDVLREVVNTEVRRLGSGLYVRFVSGLATIDPKTQKEIRQARSKARKILDDNRSVFTQVNQDCCEVPGEYIEYFSLDCRDGRFTVRKGVYPRELLAAAERLYDEGFSR